MNVHPPLSSAPAIFFSTGLLLGLLGASMKPFRTSLLPLSRALFFLGILALPLSYLSGLASESLLSQATLTANGPYIEKHEGVGRFSFFFALIPLLFLSMEMSVQNPRTRKILSLCFCVTFLALTALVDYTSFLGGHLVFEHGTGVEN